MGCSVIRSLGCWCFKCTVYLFFILPHIANKAGRHPARPVPGRTRLKKPVSALQFLFKLSDSNQGRPEQNHLQGLSQRTDPHGTTTANSLQGPGMPCTISRDTLAGHPSPFPVKTSVEGATLP